jgi:hypothetical protein
MFADAGRVARCMTWSTTSSSATQPTTKLVG